MRINRKEIETCPFVALGEGEIFENEENQQICIKIKQLRIGDTGDVEDDIINAIDVVDGSVVFFYDDDYVIRLDAELKIN
jgi:hypothetical protein